MGKFKKLCRCIRCGHCILSNDGKIAYCVKFKEYIGNEKWSIFCDEYTTEKSKLVKKIIEISNNETKEEVEK